MPRVHKVNSARKDYPNHGIKKGDTYYWWKFRFGGKRVSLYYPKRSQLTQSAFLGTIYDIEDDLAAANSESDLQSLVESCISDLEELRDEQEEKRDNMPEQLQDSPTGELLQERYDALDDMITELEGLSFDELDDDNADRESIIESILEEISNISYQGG